MNILCLHSASDLYGSGKILHAAVKVLHSEGYHCLVLLPENGPLADELLALGAEVQIIDLGIIRRKYNTASGIVNRLWFLSVAVVRVLFIIYTKDIEIVYSNTTAVFAGAIASRLARKPHLWHIHEIIIVPNWLAKSVSWFVRNFATSAIAVSEAVRRNIDRFSPVSSSPIKVIYNGIDTAPFDVRKKGTLREELGLPKEAVMVGMIGRVHYWKGQEYFLRIAARVARECPDARFVMVGDAFPGYEYLYDKIRDLKTVLQLDERVMDLGFRSDIPKVLEMLDVFILPSIQPDPFPTVVLEAMAAAVPVVATAHGGATEMVVPETTGLLIPWDNEEEAARILRPLLWDSDKRAAMGRLGRKRLDENFSLASFNLKIVKEIRSLAERRSAE